MSQIPPEEKIPPASGKSSTESLHHANREGLRIADAASQLSPEDLAQLRQYIDRHHAKLFQ